MDILIQSETKICGEIYLPISFSFMSNSQGPIKKIYSHAQGIKNLPNKKIKILRIIWNFFQLLFYENKNKN